MFIDYLFAFLVGGLICAVGQILLDRTRLTPARILVLFVVAGAALYALGVYEPLVELAGAGATVPIMGFGYSLARGAAEGVARDGFLGALSGGVVRTAPGISAVVFLGYVISLVAKPGDKS